MRIMDDSNGDIFENFPMSRKLKDLFDGFGAEKFLRRYFLRLACQNSFKVFIESDDGKRRDMAENLLCRALLEKCAKDGETSF